MDEKVPALGQASSADHLGYFGGEIKRMDFRGMKLVRNDGSPKNKGVFVIYAASQFYRKLGLKHVCVLSQFLWARSSGIAWVGSRLRVKVLQSKCCPGRRS